MVLIALVLLGWCVLSLPVGILVGRLLRSPHPAEATSDAHVASRPGSHPIAV